MKRLDDKQQLETFESLKESFQEKLKSLPQVGSSLVKPEWQNNVALLSKSMEKLDRNFLRIGSLQQAMFMNDQGDLMRSQVDLIEDELGELDLSAILKESPIGGPPKAFTDISDTSHNNIHHLYHLARYSRKIGKENLMSVESVVEWGGGYGNLCKVFYALSENLKTYTIVDLPLFSALQWLYLSSVFGPDSVNYVDENNSTLVERKINIIPLNMLDKIDVPKPDMFLSTWALSESTIECQNIVLEKKWFGAEKLLLSFHQCGDHIPFMNESTNIGLAAKKDKAVIQNVVVIPGKNLYAFK